MNILILNWRDMHHPLAGGAERMLLVHAKYWKEKGAHVTWVAAGFPGALKKDSVEGITIERFGSQYTIHLLFLLQALQGKYKNADIIIDCFHFLPFFSPLVLKNKKIFALIHEVAGGVWFDNLFFPFAFIGYMLEPLFFRFYSNIQFITVSKSTKEELTQIGINKNEIHIIRNGVTVPEKLEKHKKTSHPSLVFLNRISSDKGIIDALKAFVQIKKELPHARFIIAGNEQEKGTMQKLFKQYTTEDITYLGFVSEKEKWRLLQESWILVHPSKKEGWGLSVIEANAMGTPAVGYNVPGLRDSVQHNKTGILVEPNANSLADAIKRLLSNKELLQKMSMSAKKWANMFSWEQSTEKCWKLIIQ